MNVLPPIGFSQRLQLDWLRTTAKLAAEGQPEVEIRQVLDDLLMGSLSVGASPVRGNRDKAITILLKAWVRVPKERQAFRDEGLTLLKELPQALHVAVHWGACMAAYPFFGDVAQATGRLLRLQDEVTASQVQSRLKERFGDRETVHRAARRTLRTYVDWGGLEDTVKKGVYRATSPRNVHEASLLCWLAEAHLLSCPANLVPLAELRQSSRLFPFDISSLDASLVAGARRIEPFRQGVDEVLVGLRG